MKYLFRLDGAMSSYIVEDGATNTQVTVDWDLSEEEEKALIKAFESQSLDYFANGEDITPIKEMDSTHSKKELSYICDNEQDAAGYVVFADPNEIAEKTSVFDTQDGVYKTLEEAQERARLISGAYPYHVARYWDFIKGDYNHLDK